MNEGPKNLAEIARQRAAERAPEHANTVADFTSLLERKRQLELVLSSAFPESDRDGEVTRAITHEAKAHISTSERAVRDEIAGLEEELRKAGTDAEAFSQEVTDAAKADPETFKASDFAQDPSAGKLHEKVQALREIENAAKNAEPALRAKLGALGISEERLNAGIEDIYNGTVQPDRLNPDDVFKQAVRKLLYEELRKSNEGIEAATKLNPEFAKLVEESATSPYEKEVNEKLTSLKAERAPLADAMHESYGQESSLKYFEEDLSNADRALFFALEGNQYPELFANAGATAVVSGDRVHFNIDTRDALDALAGLRRKNESAIRTLQMDRDELARKKAGGFLQMKQSTKDEGLAEFDRKIATLADTRLPTESSIRDQAQVHARNLERAFNSPPMREVLRKHEVMKDVPFKTLVATLEQAVASAREEGNFSAKREEISAKRAELETAVNPLDEEINPLTKAKATIDNNRFSRP